MLFITKAHAAISGSTFGIDKGFGRVVSLYSLLTFLFNMFYYLGWAIMAVGVMYTFAFIGQKLIFADAEKETFEIFSGGVTKIIIIFVSGLLMISAAFLVRSTGDVFGFDMTKLKLSIPFELY